MDTLIQATPLPLVAPNEPAANLTIAENDTLIRRTILPGGLRVITQHVPAVRSVAVTAMVGAGSRDEDGSAYGSTHYLEHLLFKGTAARDAFTIAAAIDGVGGESNAVTAKEYTAYYARVLAEDLGLAVDIITDMVTSARLDEHDFQTEQTVILEELAAASDDPAAVAHEAWAANIFGDHALGRPVGGTPETVRATTLDDVRRHYRETYVPRSIVFAAAGAVDHDQLCAEVASRLAGHGWDMSALIAPNPRRREDIAQLRPLGERIVINRDTEQNHVLVGGHSLPAGHPNRPIMSVLLTLLGGGMSSRLFQAVRERRGLAYSTYAFDDSYTDAGAFAMYAGCSPAATNEVIDLMYAELADIAAGHVTDAELERVRGQLRGGIALGMEDTTSRMFRLARADITHGKLMTVGQTLAKLASVTRSDIAQLAQELLDRPQYCTIVGKE